MLAVDVSGFVVVVVINGHQLSRRASDSSGGKVDVYSSTRASGHIQQSCALQLYVTVVRYSCTLQLYVTAVRHKCTLQLYVTAVRYSGTLQLEFIV